MLKSAKMDQFEIDSYNLLQMEITHSTNFSFLKEHNGFREGKLHTLLGVSGGGKSTLVRSLLIDLITNNQEKKILIWLSEETVDDFKSELAKANIQKKDLLENVFLASELEVEQKDFMFFTLDQCIKENQIDFLIFDNITTSELYLNKSVGDQSRFCSELKQLVQRYQIPCLAVVHTGAQITETLTRLIDQNDIRGSKTLVNISEFFYVLQRFIFSNDKIFPTLRITKHRGQDVDSKIYFLNYTKERRIYISDRKITWENFKEAFKKRNTL